MDIKATNFLALSLEHHLLCRLFPAAFRDTPDSHSKSRSKESHKLETRCHARRTTRKRFACRSSQAKVTLDDRNFDTREYRVSYVVDVISEKKQHVFVYVCVAGELNRRRNKMERPHCVHLRFHPYFPLPRYKVRRRRVTCRCLLIAYLRLLA